MKIVFVAAAMLAAMLWGPAVAGAQDPEPAPERAIPRVRDADARPPDGPSGRVREPIRAPEPSGVSESPRPADPDTFRRVDAGAPASAAGDEGEQRQGGVRRPRSPRPSSGDAEGGQRRPIGRAGRGDVGGPEDGIAIDRAVPRSSAPRPSRPVYVYRANPWPWYYAPWGYGGVGIGYQYYSPWSWYGGYGGYGGYGYGGYDPYGGYYPRHARPYSDLSGSVRLKVNPRDAEVFVDGYYAGIVDDFDGRFQSLKLDTGGYRIEVRKPGFETLSFDLRVQFDRTITYRGDMRQSP